MSARSGLRAVAKGRLTAGFSAAEGFRRSVIPAKEGSQNQLITAIRDTNPAIADWILNEPDLPVAPPLRDGLLPPYRGFHRRVAFKPHQVIHPVPVGDSCDDMMFVRVDALDHVGSDPSVARAASAARQDVHARLFFHVGLPANCTGFPPSRE